MIMNLKLTHRLLYFILVGVLAATIHLLVVYILVSIFDVMALLANIVAFFIAFNISFIGHQHLTFAHMQDKKKLQLTHYFAVAASAGIINEVLYFVLLKYTDLNYLLALFGVLIFVSCYSFTMSRFWACR